MFIVNQKEHARSSKVNVHEKQHTYFAHRTLSLQEFPSATRVSNKLNAQHKFIKYRCQIHARFCWCPDHASEIRIRNHTADLTHRERANRAATDHHTHTSHHTHATQAAPTPPHAPRKGQAQPRMCLPIVSRSSSHHSPTPT